MFDRERQENGQTHIGHRLVFHCTAYHDIVVAVGPVVRGTFHKPVDAFGEEKEPQVASLLDHSPAFGPPGVCVFQEEIGSKAGKDDLAALDLPRLVPFFLDGEIEITCFTTCAARDLAAVHLILTVDIAILAPGADLGATVPRIPVGVYFPMLGHLSICRSKPPDGFGVEVFALCLGDGIAEEAGAASEAVGEVADKEVVDVSQIEPVVPDILMFLQGEGVIHGHDGIGQVEVFTAENVKTHLVEMAVETVSDFCDFAFEDAPERQGHRPVR